MNPDDVERCKKVVREHFASTGMYSQFDLDHPVIDRNSALFYVIDATNMNLTHLQGLEPSFKREFGYHRFFFFNTCSVQQFYSWAKKYFTIVLRP